MKVKYDEQYKDRITGEKLQVIDSVLVGSKYLLCMVCLEPTIFVDICSEGHICSEECNKQYYTELEKFHKDAAEYNEKQFRLENEKIYKTTYVARESCTFHRKMYRSKNDPLKVITHQMIDSDYKGNVLEVCCITGVDMLIDSGDEYNPAIYELDPIEILNISPILKYWGRGFDITRQQ